MRIGDTPPPNSSSGVEWPTVEAVNDIRDINQYIYEMDAGTFNENDRPALDADAAKLIDYSKIAGLDPTVKEALLVLGANIPIMNAPGLQGVDPQNLAEHRSLVKGYIVVAMGDTGKMPPTFLNNRSDSQNPMTTIMEEWLKTGTPSDLDKFQADVNDLPKNINGDEGWAILLLRANTFGNSPSLEQYAPFNKGENGGCQDPDLVNFCLEYAQIIPEK